MFFLRVSIFSFYWIIIPFNASRECPKTIYRSFSILVFVLVFSTVFIGNKSKAQGIIAEPNSVNHRVQDTSQLESSLAYISKTYSNTLKENLKIYTGTELVNAGTKVKGSPYLEDDQFLDTDIFFEDFLFTHIPSRLDLVTGQLVIQDYLKKNLLEIKKEKVVYFIRNQSFFVRMVPDSDLNRNLKEGIYQVIWSKKIPLYLFRVKTASTPSGVGISDITFLEYDHYFIKVEGRFYPFDDVNSFLKALPDKKEEMKEFVRSHKISKNQDFKAYLLILARKYSEL